MDENKAREIILEKLLDKMFTASGVFGTVFLLKRLQKLEIENRKNKYQIMWSEKYYEKWLNDPEIDESTKIHIISMLGKSAKEFSNIYKIVKKSINDIRQDADPSTLNEDWLSFFVDRAKNITTEEMQFIWARVLAESINDNNICSKTLLHTLSLLSSGDAMDFQNVCRFCLSEFRPKERYNTDRINVYPIVFFSKNIEYFKEANLSRGKLSRLERLGLLDLNYTHEFSLPPSAFPLVFGRFVVDYAGTNNIETGNVVFTYDGYLLYQIIEKVNSNPRKTLEFIFETWKNRGYDVQVKW